ncbi:MAG: sulfatase-like hydrolase/transferase, partial [Planctomycetota bacterium]
MIHLCINVPLLILLLLAASCSDSRVDRPNVLFVVWDTARADRMSLYGYDKTTTPFLDRWAERARVFERCTSTGGSTVTAHGAMFTGLFPTEHGANNKHPILDEGHETLAEIFQDNGYATYLYSANPHISDAENFDQGFEKSEHPWTPRFEKTAKRIIMNRLKAKKGSGDFREMFTKKGGKWGFKAPDELIQNALLEWFDKKDDDRPFFVFLNYMVAHQPLFPQDEYRERFMTPDQVKRSYEIDHAWSKMWEYTFGLYEYPQEELEILSLVYDACMAELDALFESLISALAERGLLDNTIVVLTSDHGEHLGEHHMLDHMFLLHEELLDVPLVIHYPKRIEPGREKTPVVNIDLFPTLLELAGIDVP